MFKKLTLLLVVVLAMVACADNGVAELPGDPVCMPESGTPAPDFVGLSEADALELAEESQLQVREVGRDGECFALTMDLRDDRVNLEFIDDVVVAAAIF